MAVVTSSFYNRMTIFQHFIESISECKPFGILKYFLLKSVHCSSERDWLSFSIQLLIQLLRLSRVVLEGFRNAFNVFCQSVFRLFFLGELWFLSQWSIWAEFEQLQSTLKELTLDVFRAAYLSCFTTYGGVVYLSGFQFCRGRSSLVVSRLV